MGPLMFDEFLNNFEGIELATNTASLSKLKTCSIWWVVMALDVTYLTAYLADQITVHNIWDQPLKVN